MFVKIIDRDICGGEPAIDWLQCDTDDKDLVERIVVDACDIVFYCDNQFNEYYGAGFGEVMNLVNEKLKEKGISCTWFDADLEINI